MVLGYSRTSVIFIIQKHKNVVTPAEVRSQFFEFLISGLPLAQGQRQQPQSHLVHCLTPPRASSKEPALLQGRRRCEAFTTTQILQ